MIYSSLSHLLNVSYCTHCFLLGSSYQIAPGQLTVANLLRRYFSVEKMYQGILGFLIAINYVLFYLPNVVYLYTK